MMKGLALKRGVLPLAAFAAIVAFPLVSPNPYYLRLATTVALYVILTSGLNVQVGLAGQLDMGYVAFYAVGAYTYALCSSPQLGLYLPSAAAFGAGVLAAVVLSLIVGLPSLRLHGDYLAIVTLGFAEIVRILLQNLDHPVNITNGPNGIIGIRPISIGSFSVDSPVANYYAMVLFAAAAMLFYARLIRSRLGLVLRALKHDGLAASSFGVDTRRTRLVAFSIGAFFAGTAGALFASWQGAVFPQNFTVNELIVLYCMIILGGTGNLLGTFIGVAALVLLPEALRSYAVYRMLFYGLALIVMMLYRPQGILPARYRRRVATLGTPAEKAGLPSPQKSKGNGSLGVRDPQRPVLEVKAINKRFGGLLALDDVSLSLLPGQILGIIGPNGAGKTTLLNVITGVTKPTSGECYLGHTPLGGLSPHAIYKLGLARTFQNLRLFAGLSVFENVAVGLGGDIESCETRALEALGSVSNELVERAEDPAESLSYAGKKRLELARAVASRPAVILLDEPAAGMNPKEVEDLRQRILKLKREGYSVILVEHRMPLVMGVCDTIVVLDHGRKIAEGTPAEVSANPEVVRAYLGTGDRGVRPTVGAKGEVTCEAQYRASSEAPCGTQCAGHATWLEAMAPLLEVEGLDVSYGPARVLYGIDLSVAKGEIACILGNNGAGKTTAMRAILGALKPSGGRILFRGGDITGFDPASVIGKGIAIVPEGRRVFARMTVLENLLVGGYGSAGQQGIKEDEALDYVYSLFGLLKERRNQKAGTLSGGEQQMLAIGRALMARPELLLLDEPSMGLAPIMVDRIFQVILELNHRGTTVLMVEQNAQKALEIAERGYVLQNGHMVNSGNSRELLESSSLSDAYLGSSLRQLTLK